MAWPSVVLINARKEMILQIEWVPHIIGARIGIYTSGRIVCLQPNGLEFHSPGQSEAAIAA